MTITIAVRFPWGRYHGTPWGRNVNEGATDWPPDPWRLLRALFATWKNRAPQLDAQVVEGALAKLAGAPTIQLPKFLGAHTRHYMPDSKSRSGTESTDKVLDAFIVTDPRHPIQYTWDAELTGDEASALQVLCHLLPYLGRAESLCEADLLVSGPSVVPGSAELTPIEDTAASGVQGSASLDLLVPDAPLDFEALQVRPSALRRKRFIEPPGSSRIRYPAPSPAVPMRPSPNPHPGFVEAVRYRIVSNARPHRTAALALTTRLRSAAQSQYGQRNDAAASAMLGGKDAEGAPLTFQHRHAHYIAFSSDPAQALLDTLVVWMPGLRSHDGAAFLPSAADLQALGSIEELRPLQGVREFRGCRLGIEGIGAIEDVAPEVSAPSVRWESYTPFLAPRHAKKTAPEAHAVAEINRELDVRGLPAREIELVSTADLRHPITRGWLDFRRHRPGSQLRAATSGTGARITFQSPVNGPILLGKYCHFGMGLFVPIQEG